MIRLASNLSEYDYLVAEILKLAKEGLAKKDMILKFGLSRPRVRRLTAELVNKDLMRYYIALNSFMTTARGNLYLET